MSPKDEELLYVEELTHYNGIYRFQMCNVVVLYPSWHLWSQTET